MIELEQLSIGGMAWHKDLLWVAIPEEPFVATYDPISGETEKKLTYPHTIWDVHPDGEEVWIMTGGGTLGRQLVHWSLKEEKELQRFNSPDGAGAGFTVSNGKLWVTHRHKRKLICLDPKDGKPLWVIRSANETFSPSACGSEFWLIESNPGPLGHWGQASQGRYFFSRYDLSHERIVERIAVPFVPTCMAFDGERFWYSEKDKKGCFHLKRALANSERY